MLTIRRAYLQGFPGGFAESGSPTYFISLAHPLSILPKEHSVKMDFKRSLGGPCETGN